ncbi:unnamed protein product [Caenorhabditis brenneri]
MIGLAAERKRNNVLVVVSPNDGFEFDINEDLLNVNMINLGDFCEIKVNNNTPESFVRKTPAEFSDLNVESDEKEGTVKVFGVVGVLTSKLALFYQTKEFGDVPCKDENPGEVGTKHSLVISRLPENQRTGMYSKYVWQGFSDRKYSEPGTEDGDSQEVTYTDNDEKEDEEPKVSDDEEAERDTVAVASNEVLPKLITGFITGTNPKFDTSYVSCNLTYPGVDGIVYCSKNRRLKVGDWVEVRFTEADFAKFFPSKPTSETPRFTFTHFKKIKRPSNYTVRMTDKGPEVEIKNYELPPGHKTGNDIEDRFLGTISDGQSSISNRHEVVDLIIRRRKPFKTKNKNYTTWFVKSSKKAVVRSDSTDSERSSSSESRQPTQKAPVKKSKAKHERLQTKNNGGGSVVTQHSELPSMGVTGAPPATWNMIPSYNAAIRQIPLNLLPSFSFTTCSPQMPPVFEAKVAADHKSVKKGFDKSTEDKEEFVHKRAVITSVKPSITSKHGKDSSAFLWLLDDHVSSVYYFSSREDTISVGHFFEGVFMHTGKGWECKRYVKSLGKLMDGVAYNDSIELRITVYAYLPASPGRKNAETYHNFIGKIIDKHNQLPGDCSSGVKIRIRLYKDRTTDGTNYCWIVAKKNQSKHIQLITEFYDAWHRDGVRNAVRLRCPRQFGELRGLLDTASAGQISHAYKQKQKLDKDNGVENQKETDIFAWVTAQNGDSFRMVVFPRVEGQKMSDMKKNVTDRNVYEKVEQMEVQRLYIVKLNENGDVIKMYDCPQYFSARSNGEIEFKVVSSDKTLLARNLGIVDPIGMPKWVGKLMFCSDQPISKERVLMKSGFRLLDDKDLFVDDELVSNQGVCFISVGSAEKLPNQNLDEAEKEEQIEQKENRQRQTLFQTRLECTPKDVIFENFKAVCRILEDSGVIEAMEKQSIDTDRLNKLRATSL